MNMKRFAVLLFGIVWCGIVAVITWAFSYGRIVKSDFTEPYSSWMVYTAISGFWALGVVIVVSGIARLFSRTEGTPKSGSLLGKLMFVILGAMFALLGAIGICGTVAGAAFSGESGDSMFFRILSLVPIVVQMVVHVVMGLIGLLVFFTGVRELARPLRKKKANIRA